VDTWIERCVKQATEAGIEFLRFYATVLAHYARGAVL
jgi:hypothetical protein